MKTTNIEIIPHKEGNQEDKNGVIDNHHQMSKKKKNIKFVT